MIGSRPLPIPCPQCHNFAPQRVLLFFIYYILYQIGYRVTQSNSGESSRNRHSRPVSLPLLFLVLYVSSPLQLSHATYSQEVTIIDLQSNPIIETEKRHRTGKRERDRLLLLAQLTASLASQVQFLSFYPPLCLLLFLSTTLPEPLGVGEWIKVYILLAYLARVYKSCGKLMNFLTNWFIVLINNRPTRSGPSLRHSPTPYFEASSSQCRSHRRFATPGRQHPLTEWPPANTMGGSRRPPSHTGQNFSLRHSANKKSRRTTRRRWTTAQHFANPNSRFKV